MVVENGQKRAVLTVLGSDKVGIVAKVTALLAKHNANILDISQTLLEDLFTMLMLIDIDNLSQDFESLSAELEELSQELAVQIKLQNEEVFRYMHRI